MLAVVLSARLLKERVGPAAAALAAAACWGTSTVLVRFIGRTDPTSVQMLSANGIFVLGSLVPLAWLWRTPDGSGFAIMLGLGAAGGLGQWLLLEGLRRAPASALAPVEYTGLVWAGVYGYAVWADVPGPGTFAGAALIVAGSLGLVWSESRARRTT